MIGRAAILIISIPQIVFRMRLTPLHLVQVMLVAVTGAGDDPPVNATTIQMAGSVVQRKILVRVGSATRVVATDLDLHVVR